MRAALSQVSLVIGLGNSCSQALLLNCPSQMVGSGIKIISRPESLLTSDCALETELRKSFLNFTVLADNAVPSTIPVCNALFQVFSKSDWGHWVCQNLYTIS